MDEIRTPQLKIWEDAGFVPTYMANIWQAPANEAVGLNELCHYVVKYREEFEERSLGAILYESMLRLFHLKTDIFLVDHHDKESCEKLGWPDDYRDNVLFSKERDTLVGHYFGPMTDNTPGRFSEFINQWAETENLDQLLHFIDFCRGSKNPTFEHYLLFTHPTLAHTIKDKKRLHARLQKTIPLLKMIKSPTWEKETRTILEL